MLKVDSFGRVLLRFASSQLLSSSISLITGFVIMRLVNPESYGLFTSFQVYLGYITLMHGGVLNGISRELPYLLGKGEKSYSLELVSNANFITFLISSISTIAFFHSQLFNFSRQNTR